MRKKVKKFKKAFTLAELTVTIALFALVAGMVLSFISFMSNFTKSNGQHSERVNQMADCRVEIDTWFSYFDKNDYNFEIPSYENGNDLIVKVSNNSESYSVKFSQIENKDNQMERVVVFSYPSSYHRGNFNTTTNDNEIILSATQLKNVNFYKTDNNSTEITDDNTVMRFTINCNVQKIVFACEILCK